MQKYRMDSIALILAFLICIVSISNADEKSDPLSSPLSLLPPDTIAALCLGSIEQGSNHLNAFVLPAAGLPLGSELEKLLMSTLRLESLEGIDCERPIWIFGEFDEESDIHVSMLVPLLDAEKVISQSGLEKQETGEYTGKKRTVLFGEKAALFCEGEMNESWKSWFSSTDCASLFERPSEPENDLTLWLQTTKFTAMLRELTAPFLQTMQGFISMTPFGSPQTISLLEKETGWVLDLMDQVNAVRLDLRLSSEAAVLEKRVSLKEDSPAAGFFHSARFSDMADVQTFLKPDNLVSLLLDIDPQIYTLARERMLKDFESLNFKSEPMQKLWDKAASMYRGPIGVAVNVSSHPDRPVDTTQLIALQDISGASDFLASMSAVMADTASLLSPATGIRLEITEEKDIGTYKKIPYSKMSFRYKVDDPESPLAAMFAKQNQDYFYALTDTVMIFTTESMPEVLDRVLESKPGMVPDSQKEKTMASMRINLLQGLKAAKQYFAQNMQGINPLQMIEIPPVTDNPGITLKLSIEDDEPVTRFTVPAKEISAVREAVLGGMQKQQEGGMGQ